MQKVKFSSLPGFCPFKEVRTEIAIGTVPMEESVLTSLNRGTEDDRDSVLPDSGSHIHLYGELSTIAADATS